MVTDSAKIAPYQKEFIDFLVGAEVLTFGDFVTKSGRNTPYFINTGKFDSGEKISRLGKAYAEHIRSQSLGDFECIFGPAYKGIPLAVATSAALFQNHGVDVGYAFDRKEVKDHGDGGGIVGRQLKDGDRIVIVEDVITAGMTLKALLPQLQKIAKIRVSGIVVAVNRCERGAGSKSALREIEDELGIKCLPIVTIHQIVSYLSEKNSSGLTLAPEVREKIAKYLDQYGASDT